MRVIGVIDLKDGQAVHARGGRRDTYAAVQDAGGVTISGAATELARVYIDTFGLADLYIADLNAIASRPPQDDIIRRISTLGATVSVDGGVATHEDARRVVEAGAHMVVVGLETLPSFDALADICRACASSVTFSLDLRDGVPMGRGAEETVGSPEDAARLAIAAGVQTVIVLDVARVGGGMGPGVEMVRRIREAVPDVSVLAGGGVRGLDDLRQLAAVGCDGALVATALHDGRLTAADVAAAHAF